MTNENSATDPEPADPRPKPEFGEYAPEGWVNPVTQAADQASAASPSGSAKRLDGVPHNLGVNASAPRSAAPAESAGTPSTDNQPKRSLFGGSARAGTSASTAAPSGTAASARPADRIITIALLAIGAYGALSVADAMINLQQVFAQLYASFGLGAFTPPDWFAVLSSVGGIVQLSLWAVTLLMSIQFMRRGRLAFYLPLVAGAVSFLVAIVIMSIALGAAPELMTYLSTNGFTLEDLQ